MLIFDEKSKQKLDSILIMLTPSEKDELISYLRDVMPEKGDHFHLYDHKYQKIITIAVYTTSNKHLFNDEIQAFLDAE